MSIRTSSGTTRSAPSRHARRSRSAAPRPSHQRRAHHASGTPNRSRHTERLPHLHRRIAFTPPRPGGTVAGAHRQGPRVWGYVLLPLAAPHHRRDGLVFGRPSTKGQAIVALSWRRSRQPQLVLWSARPPPIGRITEGIVRRRERGRMSVRRWMRPTSRYAGGRGHANDSPGSSPCEPESECRHQPISCWSELSLLAGSC